MVLVDSRGISRVPRYSGTCRESARCRLRGCHPLWPIVPDRSTTVPIDNSPALNRTGPATPPCKHDGLGCSAFARRYWRNHCCFLFLRVLRWFTSPGCLLPPYGFRWRSSGISLSGLPHSEILGSKPVCGSPKLFAAYHVLHRLLAPRHSPYALSSLTICYSELTPIGCSGLGARDSEDRLFRAPNTETRDPTRDSSLHTACVKPPALAGAVATSLHSRERRPDLWSEKNYRLQDIQLSKIFRGKNRPSELTAARGAFPRTPFAHSLAGPQSPRSVRPRLSLKALGALPLDQAFYPMAPLASLQAGPF